MRPALMEGDYLVVRPITDRPRVGEVVVYSRGGQLWAHRLLARSPSGRFMLTKGDARGRPDSPVSPEEMVGRAVAVERGGRRLSLESLGSRLAGLAVSLSGPAAALGRRIARSTGLSGPSRRLVPAAGFTVEVRAAPRILEVLPRPRRRRPTEADFALEVEARMAPTTGGRYGLAGDGRKRYTFSSPAVLARMNLERRHCRAALLPGMEDDGLVSLLRTLSILMVIENGRGLALHASAALREGRAYVFAGPGGAGKSTALARMAEAGAKPLADDLVLLRRVSGSWLVWGPPLERNVRRKGYAPRKGAPIAALMIPARGNSRLELEPLTPARWAATAAVFPPVAPLYEKLLDRLGSLAESAPAFRAVYEDRRGALDRLFSMLDRQS
jgi:hypothetical protein